MRGITGVIGVLLVGVSTSCRSGAARVSDEVALQQSLTRYVAALTAGDAAAAMKERCAGAQISAGDRELFTTQAKQLIAMAGITGARVVLPATIRVAAVDKRSDPINFDYVITTHHGDAERLHGAAVIESGAVRLCGYAQPDVDCFTTAISAPPTVGASPTEPLRALVPDDPLDGSRLVEDQANPVRPGAPPGRVDSWTRAWEAPGYGGARVTATRYESTRLASEPVVASWKEFASDITEGFSIPLFAGAVGIRLSATAWSWIQPPNNGYQIDLVFLFANDNVVTASVAGLRPADDHHLIETLAAAAYRATRV